MIEAWREGLVWDKDPRSENEPRGLDFTKWLAEIGPAIVLTNCEWTAEPSGLTLGSFSVTVGGKMAQLRYASGTDQTAYVLTVKVTCSDGTVDYRSVTVNCAKR